MVEPWRPNGTIHVPVAVYPNTPIRDKRRRHTDNHRWWGSSSIESMRVWEGVGAHKRATCGTRNFMLLEGMDLPQPFFMDA